VIGVYTPLPLRIQRIMHRDKLKSEEVKRRINRQLDEQIKMKLCNTVIVNDEQQLLITQVTELHQKLIMMAMNT
jgi:dephospho-CoA kinase